MVLLLFYPGNSKRKKNNYLACLLRNESNINELKKNILYIKIAPLTKILALPPLNSNDIYSTTLELSIDILNMRLRAFF